MTTQSPLDRLISDMGDLTDEPGNLADLVETYRNALELLALLYLHDLFRLSSAEVARIRGIGRRSNRQVLDEVRYRMTDEYLPWIQNPANAYTARLEAKYPELRKENMRPETA